MKILTVVYMIHTQKEFGNLARRIQEIQIQKRGARGAQDFFDEIENYWEEVGRRIHEKFLNEGSAKQLAIFIDGLPNVDDQIVQKIVTAMIEQKIPAYLIIQKLEEAGAKVYGTEDPKLLLEEHGVWTQASKGERADPQKLQELLKMRDCAIAKRIDDILSDEGEGLLFIGKAHDVVGELEKLKTHWRVTYL